MKKNRGFTLIEILVAVGIIGLLAGIVLANVGEYRLKAKHNQTISAAREMREVLRLYFFENGHYPQVDPIGGFSHCLADYPDDKCGVVNESSSFLDELYTVADHLPKGAPVTDSFGGLSEGPLYRCEEGVPRPCFSGESSLVYYLEGDNQDCVLSEALDISSSGEALSFGFTTCEIPLPQNQIFN